VTKAHDALTKAFGNPETPGFKRSVEMGRRAIKNLSPGLHQALRDRGVLVQHNGQEAVADAEIFSALVKLGSAHYAEDSVFGDQSTSENPFDPKKPNLTKQAEVLKKNPELAKTLIRAAGAESEWNWWFAKNAKK
jgi:hypothetical protein